MKNCRMNLLILALTICGMTILFQRSAVAQTGKDIEQAKQSLLEFDRAFNKVIFEQGIAAAFDSFMADDATIYRNGMNPFAGRKAIHDFLWQTPSEGKGTMRCEPYFADVAKSLDMGYTLGKYEFTATDSTGKADVIYGHYMAIYKKQADGKWKAVFDGDITSPAPEKK